MLFYSPAPTQRWGTSTRSRDDMRRVKWRWMCTVRGKESRRGGAEEERAKGKDVGMDLVEDKAV